MPGVQYLYTPFAAAGFAVTSLLPWTLLKWLMATASFAAVPLTVWVTFGSWAGAAGAARPRCSGSARWRSGWNRC